MQYNKQELELFIDRLNEEINHANRISQHIVHELSSNEKYFEMSEIRVDKCLYIEISDEMSPQKINIWSGIISFDYDNMDNIGQSIDSVISDLSSLICNMEIGESPAYDLAEPV